MYNFDIQLPFSITLNSSLIEPPKLTVWMTWSLLDVRISWDIEVEVALIYESKQ